MMNWLQENISVWWNLFVLRTGNWINKGVAAEKLGKLKSKKAVPALLIALNDENQNVRANAASALFAIEDERAIGPFIDALKDEFWLVRFWGARALGTRIEESAVEPLIPLLKDNQRNVRELAASALARHEYADLLFEAAGKREFSRLRSEISKIIQGINTEMRADGDTRGKPHNFGIVEREPPPSEINEMKRIALSRMERRESTDARNTQGRVAVKR